MAFLNETFDVNELPQGNFEPLPAGWYTARITNAELKATKAGTGQYIAILYDIEGPTHNGRIVFGNINIRNPNIKAEEIGRQQLGELMRAVGLAKVNDTDQLIGCGLQIKVDIRHQDGYDPTNEVRGFKAITGEGMPKPAMPAQAAQAASSKASPPWAK